MTDTAAAPVADREVILEARDLNVDFWVDGKFYPAVKDAAFKVHAGEVLAIVGESGSGKSTTATSIIDLLPGTGTVTKPQAHLTGAYYIRADGTQVAITQADLDARVVVAGMKLARPVYSCSSGSRMRRNARSSAAHWLARSSPGASDPVFVGDERATASYRLASGT